MSIFDLALIAAVAAAAVVAAAQVLKGKTGCGTCENCPGSIYCRKKKI